MEPERPIEKLLQAVAKKRREQAGQPFEMHPATRQELLREASRRAAKKSGGGFFAQIFSGFGPRLALALSAVVILVAVIWIARPLLSEKGKPSTLAMADRPAARPAAQNEPAQELAPPPVSAAPAISGSAITESVETPANVGARRSAGEVSTKAKAPNPTPQIAVNSGPSEKDAANRKSTLRAESPKPAGAAQPSLALNDSSKSTVAAASTPSSAPASVYKNTRAADSFAASNAADKAATPTAPSVVTNAVAAPTTFASADRETQKELNVVTPPATVSINQAANFDANANNQTKLTPMAQNFNRVIAAPTQQRGFGGGGGGVASPLLASFRMEQNGQDIRVVDADGSVYTGSWQVAPAQNAIAAPAGRAGSLNFSGAVPATSNVNPAPAPAANNNFQAMQNYFFSVTGTNRTLNQRITFSGNFIPVANVINSANNVGAVNGLVEGRNAAAINTAPPVLLNSRIAGKAIIGDRREIEVNANPAP